MAKYQSYEARRIREASIYICFMELASAAMQQSDPLASRISTANQQSHYYQKQHRHNQHLSFALIQRRRLVNYQVYQRAAICSEFYLHFLLSFAASLHTFRLVMANSMPSSAPPGILLLV